MHPWSKIIRGKTEERMNKQCFICLERISCSDDDIELKLHLFKVHSVNVNLKELVEMCTEAEEREEREGWSLNEILEEERVRRDTEARTRKKVASGGWMKRFCIRTPESLDLDNNAEAGREGLGSDSVGSEACFRGEFQMGSNHNDMQGGTNTQNLT